MADIILDLEWNVPNKAKHLEDQPLMEIIQIGAKKIEKGSQSEEEFRCIVQAVRYPHIHWMVRKLTGLTSKMVSEGKSFPDAMTEFKRWCGKNPRFLTWGFDDIPILQRNLRAWNLQDDWCSDWYNVQILFCNETEQPVRQRSLEFAVDYYSIERDLSYHDALHDAIYTYRVCKKLDLDYGIEHYQEILSKPLPKNEETIQTPANQPTIVFHGIEDMESEVEARKKEPQFCSRCGKELLDIRRWLDVGHHRYFTYGNCPVHGLIQIWLRFLPEEEGTWMERQDITRGGPSAEQYYNMKKNNRKRHHRKEAETT